MTSSRTWASFIPSPVPSSWAASSIDSIARVRLARPPLADDPKDRAVQSRQGCARFGVARHRPQEKRSRRRDPGVDLADQERHRCADLVGRVSYVRVEERLADDVEGQAHHLGGDVDPRSVGPGALRALRVLGHRVRVAGDSLVRQRGRDELSLAPVKRALARHQAVSDDGPQEAERGSLLEAVGLRHEHLVHQIGARYDHDRPAGQRQLADSPRIAPASLITARRSRARARTFPKMGPPISSRAGLVRGTRLERAKSRRHPRTRSAAWDARRPKLSVFMGTSERDAYSTVSS